MVACGGPGPPAVLRARLGWLHPQALEQDLPTIRAVDPRTWIGTADWAGLGWAEHLAAFTADRTALLALLRGLRPDDWERSALVVGAGRPTTRTVLSYAERLAVHERAHVRQVERAAGRG